MSKSALWDAYLTSVIRIRQTTQYIAGQGAMEQLPFSDRCYVITAWNPRSGVLSLAENVRKNEALLAMIGRVTADIIPTTSSAPNGDWAEDGFLVHGITCKQALSWARRFEQYGIFELTAESKILHTVAEGEVGRVSRFQ